MSPLDLTCCHPNPNRTQIEPICKVSTSSITKNIFQHWQKIEALILKILSEWFWSGFGVVLEWFWSVWG